MTDRWDEEAKVLWHSLDQNVRTGGTYNSVVGTLATALRAAHEAGIERAIERLSEAQIEMDGHTFSVDGDLLRNDDGDVEFMSVRNVRRLLELKRKSIRSLLSPSPVEGERK